VLYDRTIETRFELDFDPTSESASLARQSARSFLDRAGIPSTVIADLELIVAELASNAVEQQPTEPIRLVVDLSDAGVHVSVANQIADGDRTDRDADPWPAATAVPPFQERGWGLGIVRALTDGFWVNEANGWTLVSCLRRHDTGSDPT
jgi:anti-sigma regulatory factor (Ser/Thr protein kinase)